jgi:hypothetical protein
LLETAKSDYPVWRTGGSGFVVTGGHCQLRREHSSSSKVASDLRKNKIHDKLEELQWHLEDLIEEKNKNKKTGAKTRF